MSYIEFKDVNKEYFIDEKANFSLKNLNFEIKKGELVIITGPSGTGKTTILNLLASFLLPDTGSIVVNKNEITKLNCKGKNNYKKNYLGFTFSEDELIEDMTVLENIILGINLSNKKIDAESYIKKLGFDDKLNYLPCELSNSEKIKASILRSICKNSPILLLDDIFVKMDNKDKKQVLKVLHVLCKKEKTTVVLTTNENNIFPIANKVITLKKGKIENVKINKKTKSTGDIKW